MTNCLVEKKCLVSGVVSSVANDKTLVVLVTYAYRHKIYKKVMKRNIKYYVHDERNFFKEKDVVKICASRPYSAKKRWVVLYGEEL